MGNSLLFQERDWGLVVRTLGRSTPIDREDAEIVRVCKDHKSKR